MRVGTLLAVLAAFLLIVSSLFAQDSDELIRGPDGGTTYHVDGISVRPLPGQPFSGKGTTEWTRTLEDGSVVTTHLFAMVARDSQGASIAKAAILCRPIRTRNPSASGSRLLTQSLIP